jgi:predicted DNA binding CopG/RHH family protein
MNDMPKTHSEDAWENRELGATESFVRKASTEHEKSLDDKMDLQIISIRLQKSLIDDLKELAGEDGLGYQPYIRQLLTHHVRNEKIKRAKHVQLIRK